MTTAPLSSGAGDVLLAHPSGHQFFRHLAGTLRDAGRLREICTCLDWREKGWLDPRLPTRITAELRRRSFSESLGVPVVSHPWREAGRLLAGRAGLGWLIRHEVGPLSMDAVLRDFDRWVAGRIARSREPGIAYAYEDGAEATFQAAKAHGWRCAYDLPIAYWATSRRLLEEEAQRWPAWEPTLGGTRDSAAKFERKTRELAGADWVMCPSRFVAESLPALGAQQKVVIAPFGSPSLGPARSSERDRTRPLRVLFAGSLSQRKGLADLLAAIRLLNRSDVELVVLGSPTVPLEFYRREGPAFRYEAPRPHGEVLALMGQCDVFCLPSIVEGRALVIQEAMSQGLPVIITANTGADDVVESGVNGFVVPIRDPAAVAEKIAWFADHRADLAEMGRQAQLAAARLTWTAYGQTILRAFSG